MSTVLDATPVRSRKAKLLRIVGIILGLLARDVPRCGVKPVSRERAKVLIAEWNEVLSGRPEPTKH